MRRSRMIVMIGLGAAVGLSSCRFASQTGTTQAEGDKPTAVRELSAQEIYETSRPTVEEVLLPETEDELAFASWVGKPLPDLRAKGIDGKSYRLSDFRGKIVFLSFWATWCRPCKAEMPDLVALYEQNRDQGFVMLGLSADIPEAQRRFREAYRVPFPLLIVDSGTELVDPYLRVQSVPTMFLIDAEGKLASVKVGMRGKATWEECLAALRGGGA